MDPGIHQSVQRMDGQNRGCCRCFFFRLHHNDGFQNQIAQTGHLKNCHSEGFFLFFGHLPKTLS